MYAHIYAYLCINFDTGMCDVCMYVCYVISKQFIIFLQTCIYPMLTAYHSLLYFSYTQLNFFFLAMEDKNYA